MNKYFESTSEVLLTSPGVFSSIAQNPAIINCRQVSPYYINCASVWSDDNVDAKNTIADNMEKYIRENVETDRIDKITTTAVKGLCIAIDVATAGRLNLPVVFVRPKGKGYGAQEGKVKPGDYVVGVDDLITEAGTAVVCINTTKENKGKIDKYFVMFDRKQGGTERIRDMEVSPFALAHMCPRFTEMIKKYREGKDVTAEDLNIFRKYAEDPVTWSKNYLLDHPEFVKDHIEKAIDKDLLIDSNAPVLEIFTVETGHPELKDEFKDSIRKWLGGLKVKNDVPEFGYTGFKDI